MTKRNRVSAGDGAQGDERRYGLAELVQLAFECDDGDTRAHERYQILRRLLGVSTDMLLSGGGPDAPRYREQVDEQGRSARSSVGAPHLAHSIVLAAKSKRGTSPFSGFLEAPPDIIALYEAHNDEIKAALEAGPDERVVALRRLAVATLRSAEPDATDRTVTLDEMRAAGWDGPPPSVIGDDDRAVPRSAAPEGAD